MPLKKFVKKDETNHGPTLMLDCHNFVFRVLFIAQSQAKQFHEDINETDFTYWKFLFIKSVMTTIKQFQPRQVIMAMDKSSWRKDVYSEYKANRKVSRDASAIDFEKFFGVMETFFEDMKNTFTTTPFLRIDKCEADDIIAVLSKDVITNNIVIVSTDKDLNQLLQYSHIKQYDPINKKYFNPTNPIQELNIKVLTGDKGDNVPGIMPKCGPVKAAKLINEGLITVTSNSVLMANYSRNRQLIDFNFIPNEISELIKSEYDKYSYKQFDGRKLFKFFIKHKMSSLLDNVQEYSDLMKRSSLCEITNQEITTDENLNQNTLTNTLEQNNQSTNQALN